MRLGAIGMAALYAAMGTIPAGALCFVKRPIGAGKDGGWRLILG